jgi:YD repeat-containing protein
MPRICLLVFVLVMSLTLITRAQSGPVRYVYDDVGRLVGVVDGSGNAATYHYDIVGNLTSITRTPAGTVLVMEFSPNGGAVGSSVTIYGAGFGATVAENTVQFNGVAGIVSEASSNRLVATVPAGATSGVISVTAPAGTAASLDTFLVGAGAAPVIMSLTPNVGTSGSTTTIGGTGFEPVLANNRLKFSSVATLADLTNATATSLVALVSSGTKTGRVRLTTPYGTAVSPGEFFVPPTPYTATDVAFTANVTPTESFTVAIPTANKIAMVAFDGVASRRVFTNVTTASTGNSGYSILKPDGTTLISLPIFNTGFIDTQTLPSSGTYVLVVDPIGTGAGNATMTVYDVPADPTAPISAGGSPVTIGTSVPGQNAALTFTGTANQRISVQLSNLSLVHTCKLLRPNGSQVFSSFFSGGSGWIDTQTLDVTGGYTLFVDGSGPDTGNVTLKLNDVPADFTGVIAPDAQPLTVTTTVPGQNALLTFDGAAQQRVSLKITSSAIPATYTILKPDGTVLSSDFRSGSADFIDTKTLPATGTYKLAIDVNTTFTGSATLTMYNVVDIAGVIAPDAQPVTVTITVPGQNALLTFDAAAQQAVSLKITNSAIPATYTILKPDGTVLSSDFRSGGADFIDTKTLPATGIYKLAIDVNTTFTGSATLTMYTVVDVTGSVAIGDPPTPVTISTPGQNGRFTLVGTAGQAVTVRITNNTMTLPMSATFRILKPDGSQLASGFTWSTTFNLSATLPVAGTYVIVVDPATTAVGSLSLQVTSP